MPAPHILVVEDENIVSKYIQQALKKLGYEVADASSGKEAIRKAEEIRPDLILMDIVLKGELDGIETAEQIHLHSDVPVVYLSGYNDQKTLERAKVTEPFGYLQKPFQERDLHTTIQTALYKNLMERRLKEREQWFSTTLKSIGEAVIATDAGERVIYMNPVAEALTGWKQQEGIGRPLAEIFNLIHDETRHKIENPVSKVIRDREPIGLENHALLITRNGREVPIDDNASAIEDDQGNLVGAVTVFRDITQRKKSEKALRRSHEGLERKIQERTGELLKVNKALRAEISERRRIEAALRESENRYRTLVETSPDAIVLADLDGNILMANQGSAALIGYEKPEGLVGKNVRDFVPSHEWSQGAEAFKKVMQTGSFRNYALLALTKDGTPFPIELSANLISDAGGKPTAIMALWRDITERRQTEQGLLSAAQQWRSTFDAIKDIVCLTDTKGTIVKCNIAMTEFAGKSFGEILDRPCWEIVHHEKTRIKECPALRMHQSLQRESAVLPVKDRWFQVVVDPLFDESGSLMGAVHIMSDITEHKKAQESLRESEDRYRDLVEASQYLICTHDLGGKILSVNQGASKLLGYDHSALMNKNIRDLLAPEVRDQFEEYLNTIKKFGSAEGVLKSQRSTGEKQFWAYNNTLRTEGVATPIVRVMAYNVTERIYAEKAIQRLSQENAIMAEIGRIISSTLNIEEVYERFAEEVRKLIPFDRIVINIIDVKKALVSNVYMSGKGIADRKTGVFYPLEGSGNAEMARTKSTLLIQTEDFDQYKDRYPMLLSTFEAGFRSIMNVPILSKGEITGGLLLRSLKPYAYTEKDVKLAERVANQIAGAIATVLLFNERSRAEEALQISEERFRKLFDEAPVGYQEFDAEARIVRVNRTELEMLGYTEEEMLGRRVWEFITETLCHDALGERLTGNVPPGQLFERTFRRKDGTTFTGLIQERSLTDDEGRIIGIRSTVQDITELKRAQEEINTSRMRLMDAMDMARIAHWEMDHQTRQFIFNDGFYALYGTTAEAEGGYTMAPEDYDKRFIHPEDSPLFSRVSEQVRGNTDPEQIIYLEHRIIRPDGQIRHIAVRIRVLRDASGNPIRESGTNQDITERKEVEEKMRALQEQLRQSQKMEAIGQLAGGVAHDFNNLLTVIHGYCELILKDLKEGGRFFQDVTEIKKASEHAASLTRQLLAFSRKQVLQPKVLDLNTLVNNTDKMLRRMIGEDIQLTTLLAQDLRRITADPGQIEQVILNLAVNARDAMPQGGKLTVETANVELDENYAQSHIGVPAGPYVMLSMSDTGHGMTPEVKERIFEPFFTTKAKGKGTGLGLSTVYGIVKQSGGNLWVYSEPGKGTTFKIYFPITVDRDYLNPSASPAKPLHGTETILLVEDEEAVRKMAAAVLLRYGYKVIEAATGEEAIRLVQEQPPGSVHLTLTDVVMPGMSGRQLAERLGSLLPKMKILYMSGYTDNAIVHHGVLDPGTAYIQKPFTPDALASKIRDVLDGK